MQILNEENYWIYYYDLDYITIYIYLETTQLFV
jgi:hypothetical protein